MRIIGKIIEKISHIVDLKDKERWKNRREQIRKLEILTKLKYLTNRNFQKEKNRKWQEITEEIIQENTLKQKDTVFRLKEPH